MFLDYDAILKDLTKALEENGNVLKTAENSLKVLTSTPTTEVAKSQISDARQRIEALEIKLEGLRTSTEVLSADEKKNLLDEHNKYLREYR